VYGRRFGLAANSIRSVELLAGDGALRTVDAESDPELLDAIRGGGGGFGLLVSATVDLHPVAEVVTGAAFWPIAVAQEILAGWCDWARDAPRTASTSFRTIRFPPDAPVPPELAAGPVVCIDGVVIDEPGQPAQDVAGGLLDPLRRIAEPLVDTWRPGGPLDVTSTHMDPLDPLPYEGEHMLLGELDRAGQDAWLSVAATDAGADLAFVELRQLGGAIGEAGADGGVLDRLDGAYALYVLGVLIGDPARDARVTQQLALARTALTPWDTGYTAPTFAAGWTDHQRSFDAATARRVQAIRDRVDPDGVFAGNVVRGARVDPA
jgi:FAD/FMN-containing dehydrogenase